MNGISPGKIISLPLYHTPTRLGYKWLTQKSENSVQDAEVTWNFQKFLIDENGNWVKSFGPKTNPLDQAIVDWVK